MWIWNRVRLRCGVAICPKNILTNKAMVSLCRTDNYAGITLVHINFDARKTFKSINLAFRPFNVPLGTEAL